MANNKSYFNWKYNININNNKHIDVKLNRNALVHQLSQNAAVCSKTNSSMKALGLKLILTGSFRRKNYKAMLS